MSDDQPLRLRFDAFDLDETDARLTQDGRPIALPPKAFAVLCTLARRPGQLVTKNQLLDAVWGHRHVSESVLKTMISALRTALSDDAKQPRYIETASRRGYRFIALAGSSRGGSMASVEVAPPRQDAGESARPVLAAPIIGRQQGLARLRAAWSEAGAGRRRVSWVAGEAGVGKTTLIDGFVAGLGSVACARGQCVEQYGAGEPYLPVLEALGSLSRTDPALAPLLRATAPTWLLQLPWLSGEAEREALGHELAGATQERMLRELGELLERYTQQRPLLLVTEDLHWSDRATLQLIDHIARRRLPARLMWLASFRLAEVISEDHPLKGLRHELRLHRLCDEIVLDPFSEREVADYIELRFPGAQVSEAFVREVHAHTDGLPLFVVNVMDDLASSGAAQGAGSEALAQAALGESQVPESLFGVIEKQIARLSPELQAMLETASVCGVGFRSRTLADALERDARWVGERCDELVRQQHWLTHLGVSRLPDGSFDARYAFRHALYRHVFYQRIGALTRAQLHRRVAESMERSRESGVAVTAAELASHFERALDPMAALQHYADAAESALRHFAPSEVVDLTTRALELLPLCPDGPRRLELELALMAPRSAACAQVLGIASPEAVAAFERAQTLCELLPATTSRAMELSGFGWGLYIKGEFAKARAFAARIHALAGSRDDRRLAVSACNLMGAAAAHQGELAVARRWLEQGIAIFSELEDQPARVAFVVDLSVSMHARLAQVLAHLGLADQARAHIDTALARAGALGHPYGRMVGLFYAGVLDVRLDFPERVLEWAAALRRNVSENAFAQGEGMWRWLQGWALARLGKPEEGQALLRDGYQHSVRHTMVSGATSVLGHLADATLAAEGWLAAKTHLDQALELAQRNGERLFLPDLLLVQGTIALGQRHPAAARRSMHAALQEARGQEALWLEVSSLLALCELDDAPAEDIAALMQARGRVREGIDTALIARTDALLQARGLGVPPVA